MHLVAHFSIERLLEPLDDAPSNGFSQHLSMVRTAAEIAEGFVWRRPEIPATDPRAMAALSVWESPAHLESFVRGPVYRPFMLRRDEWFARNASPQEVVWWISALRPPTVAEATERLRLLRTTGPGLRAFTPGVHFPPN